MTALRRLAIPLALLMVGGTSMVASAEVTESPKVVASCDQKVEPGYFTCFAQRRADLGFRARAAGAPQGYGPADLAAAHKLPSATAGKGQRVYIVDAYDDPTAESDLAVYRRQFGLPACTTDNGCFQKLNQDGKPSPLPAPSSSWSGEISLDLDMVSAVCPNCGITLIEADSPSNDLLAAVKTAENLGAKFVSLSWGGPESGNLPALDKQYFNTNGIVYAASTGDYDYEAGTSYPASSAATTAIGGTTPTKTDSGRGWAETVWNNEPGHGTGSGCSAEITKPTWQAVIPAATCQKRAVADVSAVADPATGVAVYQTTGGDGWAVYGGTSAAAPIIAATYALAGDPSPTSHPASYPYAGTANLNDVVEGNNGECKPAPLCTAQPGWDGPTGLGTPNGPASLTSPTKANRITVSTPAQQFSAVGTPACSTSGRPTRVDVRSASPRRTSPTVCASTPSPASSTAYRAAPERTRRRSPRPTRPAPAATPWSAGSSAPTREPSSTATSRLVPAGGPSPPT